MSPNQGGPGATQVSGFTLVRNGMRMDYPFLESMRSLLPLVDELVVAVGDSNDGTLERVRELATEFPGRIKIVESPWDPKKTVRGEELSRQSNIALEACSFDVCFYLQADEVLDDAEYGTLRSELARFATDESLDGLLLRWVHFYGSYGRVVHSKKWYRREIRVIKKSRGLRSFGDAQSFRKWNSTTERFEKSRCALSRAHVLHYGWAKPADLMNAKHRELAQYWGRTLTDEEMRAPIFEEQFGMRSYEKIHPAVMRKRVSEEHASHSALSIAPLKKNLRYWRLFATNFLERHFDWRPGEFKSYKSLKKF